MTTCERRFGWPTPHTGAFASLTARMLLAGLRKTSESINLDGLQFLVGEDEAALASTSLARLASFPREQRRIHRHISYASLAPGRSEYRRPARLAFIARDNASTSSELLIELHDCALLAWHLDIGGGLRSPAWAPTIEWSMHRQSHAFATKLMERETDGRVRQRIAARYPRLAIDK